MAQYKKEETQNLIIQSAEKLFSERGYHNTTISDIAKETGISVGNVYRYYKGKEQILEEVLPEEFVVKLRENLRTKIVTGKSDTINEQSKKREYLEKSNMFHRMIIENKRKLIILMQYSEETPYEDFRKNVVRNLVEFIIAQFNPENEQNQNLKDLLTILYDGYIQMSLDIAAREWDDEKTLGALRNINQYHIIGLEALLRKEE